MQYAIPTAGHRGHSLRVHYCYASENDAINQSAVLRVKKEWSVRMNSRLHKPGKRQEWPAPMVRSSIRCIVRLWLWLWAFLLICCSVGRGQASAAGVSCPPPLQFLSTGRSTGRSVVVSYKLANDGISHVQNAVVRFGLPSSTVARLTKASVFPSSKGTSRINQGSAVYWTNVTIPAKRRRKFSLKLQALACQSTVLNFDFLTYLVSANGTSYCPSGEATVAVS